VCVCVCVCVCLSVCGWKCLFVVCIAVQKAGTVSKKGEIVDRQPVTFHARIKSSGYSRAAPRSSSI